LCFIRFIDPFFSTQICPDFKSPTTGKSGEFDGISGNSASRAAVEAFKLVLNSSPKFIVTQVVAYKQ